MPIGTIILASLRQRNREQIKVTTHLVGCMGTSEWTRVNNSNDYSYASLLLSQCILFRKPEQWYPTM